MYAGVHSVNFFLLNTTSALSKYINKFPNEYRNKSTSVINVYLCAYINIKISTLSKYMKKFSKKCCHKSMTVFNVY